MAPFPPRRLWEVTFVVQWLSAFVFPPPFPPPFSTIFAALALIMLFSLGYFESFTVARHERAAAAAVGVPPPAPCLPLRLLVAAWLLVLPAGGWQDFARGLVAEVLSSCLGAAFLGAPLALPTRALADAARGLLTGRWSWRRVRRWRAPTESPWRRPRLTLQVG